LRIAAGRSRITIHRVRRSLPFLIIAGVLVFAIGGGLLLYRYRMEPEAPAPASTPIPLTTATAPPPSATIAAMPSVTPALPSMTPALPSVTPAVSATAVAPPAGPVFSYGRPGAEPMHLRGDPAAPVVLEEFGDFECLPCSLLWPVLEKLERDYDKGLVVVFREHPLKMHRYGLDAARAAEAAGLQGKFWEMHDTLYRNRANWVPAAYIRPYLNDYAAELHLDVDRFKADMEGEEVAKRLAADWDRGESLGIDRTPVVFVNGRKLSLTEREEPGLRAAIDTAMAARTTAP
jgi:protein-disulfide isomerase